jgi:hypothetical protein
MLLQIAALALPRIRSSDPKTVQLYPSENCITKILVRLIHAHHVLNDELTYSGSLIRARNNYSTDNHVAGALYDTTLAMVGISVAFLRQAGADPGPWHGSTLILLTLAIS